MENMNDNLKEIAYVRYDGRIEIDVTRLIVAAWNSVETGFEGKICLNDKAFFEDSFENAYDAAWAASAGDYRWSDNFVYFDNEGRLTSFSGLDDESCPINLEKIDINSLIKGLQEINNKKEV